MVVRSSEGLNGALRGNGFGPCIEATILSEDAGLMSVEEGIEDEEGISRYAEPEAEGTMAVCRSGAMLASLRREFPRVAGLIHKSTPLPVMISSRNRALYKLAFYLQILRSSFCPLVLVGLKV